MQKKSAGYLHGALTRLEVHRGKNGEVNLCAPPPRRIVKVDEMHDAAKEARACAVAVQHLTKASGMQGRRWAEAAKECFFRFYNHHHPSICGGNYATYGPAIAHAAWVELCDAMEALAVHLKWIEGDDDSPSPSVLADRVKQAAQTVLELEPAKEGPASHSHALHERALKLWNEGKSWPEVAREIGEDNVNALTTAVRRYAQDNNLRIRTGSRGRPPKK